MVNENVKFWDNPLKATWNAVKKPVLGLAVLGLGIYAGIETGFFENIGELVHSSRTDIVQTLNL